jgi:hypothetical protein
MLDITPVLQYNDSPVTSITYIPKGSAYKSGHLKKFETIIEGIKYVRMQCRKRGNEKKLNKREPDIIGTLKKKTSGKKENI